MTSYKKEENIFTRNPLGGKPGESEGVHYEHGEANTNKKDGGGGKIKFAFPQDNVHGVELPEDDTVEYKMGGSCHNLEHSLRGSSAVQMQVGKLKADI